MEIYYPFAPVVSASHEVTPNSPSRYWPDRETEKFIRFWTPELEQMGAEQILHWAADTFDLKLALVTVSFGLGGCVLTSMLPKVCADLEVIHIDSGYLFPETRETANRLIEKYAVNIVRHSAETQTEERDFVQPVPRYRSTPARCCHERKYGVLQKLAPKYSALIFAGRRDQSRTPLPILQWDEHLDLLRIYPLARWSKRSLWEKITRESIPYNRLLDHGYSEVGCIPCTVPVFTDWDSVESA